LANQKQGAAVKSYLLHSSLAVFGKLYKNAGTNSKPEKKWFSPNIFAQWRERTCLAIFPDGED
jgi:hypothetical protein